MEGWLGEGWLVGWGVLDCLVFCVFGCFVGKCGLIKVVEVWFVLGNVLSMRDSFSFF